MAAAGVEYVSGDAMVVVGADLRVQAWNPAAERLTGIPADAALGAHCWQLLGGTQPDGGLLCHAHCSHARLAGCGWPVRRFDAIIRSARGPRRVSLSTVVMRDPERPLLIHLVRDATTPDAAGEPVPAAAPDHAPRLTARQSEVLHLLAAGVTARAIAARLAVSEPTVRNHIRAILIALGCNSQLAAVARARAVGLL